MKQDETTNRREPKKKASKAHIAAKPQTIEHTGIRVYQQVRATIKMQKICKVRREYLTQHETKNYQEPMSLFCVGHSLLDMGPALRNSFSSRKTTLEKSAFSLINCRQLLIQGQGLCLLLLSVLPHLEQMYTDPVENSLQNSQNKSM